MIKFPSDYSQEQLIQKWDEYTSISRFAGSDDVMDLIFVSKRNGDNIRLVHKARNAYEPFSAVFRGKIRKNGQGSEIVGYFTKSFTDYALIGAVLALLFYIRSFVIERGDSLATINTLLVFAIVGSIALILNYRSTKRKYADFICRITGKANTQFLTKAEKNEENNNN